MPHTWIAYGSHALMSQSEHDRLTELVDELAKMHGPVTDEEIAAAEAEWPREPQ